MPRCCSGSSCACVLQEGTHISITGTGQAQDPFIVTADVDAAVVSTTQFDLSMTGSGTVADPWIFQVNYASTATLDGLPDVNAPSPTNGQVLGWDSSTSRWTNRAPTTAASGSVLTDNSLTGDGSSGSHLAVQENADGYIETTSTGIGIDDNGKNQMTLHYASDAVRALSSLTPQVNSLSMLDDTPGVTWYWTGTQWLPVTNGVAHDFGTGEFMAMSGSYAGGVTTLMIRQISDITAADGTFDVLSTADLSGAAGVLSVLFQETGAIGFTTVLTADTDSVVGTAYRLDDGTAFGSQAITGIAYAYVY